MTVTALILTLVIGVILKVLPASIPTKDGKALLSKFATHTKISEANTTITIEGKTLEEDEKAQFIHDFNEANFLKKHYIFPGNEQLFLQPKDAGSPIVVRTKTGNKEVQLFVYVYSDYVDVVKQDKKKIVAYSLQSDSLQELSIKGV